MWIASPPITLSDSGILFLLNQDVILVLISRQADYFPSFFHRTTRFHMGAIHDHINVSRSKWCICYVIHWCADVGLFYTTPSVQVQRQLQNSATSSSRGRTIHGIIEGFSFRISYENVELIPVSASVDTTKNFPWHLQGWSQIYVIYSGVGKKTWSAPDIRSNREICLNIVTELQLPTYTWIKCCWAEQLLTFRDTEALKT